MHVVTFLDNVLIKLNKNSLKGTGIRLCWPVCWFRCGIYPISFQLCRWSAVLTGYSCDNSIISCLFTQWYSTQGTAFESQAAWLLRPSGRPDSWLQWESSQRAEAHLWHQTLGQTGEHHCKVQTDWSNRLWRPNTHMLFSFGLKYKWAV